MGNTETNKGQTMNIKATVKDVLRTRRIHDRLTNAGIAVTLETKRAYSNFRVSCGRIQDAKVTTSYRLEVAGNTYQMRDIIKGAGFRWDPKGKVWYAAPTTKTVAMGAAMLRRLSN